jgi:NitT/TauT family transport system permease protein
LYIPSAITWFFTSLRIAFPVALIGSIVGEFIASNDGIGYVATKAASLYDSAGVFAGIIVVTVAAVVVDGLIVFIQRLVTRRHGGEGVRLVL